ncbi:MAG: nitroreductase family protein [Candidatus Eremiobacteraeota bacterium]|nr:nitroreductase family protein [Candidatus Eremiobacteraeota bacterium]
MNEVLKTIKKRRSIRKYLPNQIRQEELNAIIEAGIYAPTAKRDEPWYFTVIQDRKIIDIINEKTKLQMAKSDTDWIAEKGQCEEYHVFHHAPTVILVSGRESAFSPLIDCSAATQNMLLAAESLGIGSCWIGLIRFMFLDEEEIEMFDVPEGYKPYYAICLGYKDLPEELPIPERNREVVSYIR